MILLEGYLGLEHLFERETFSLSQTFLNFASANGRVEIVRYLLSLPTIDVNLVSELF